MILAKVVNGAVTQYPLFPSSLREEFPQTSFPSDLTSADLSDFGVFRVTETPKPSADYTQVVQESQPVLVGGNWTQVWIVRDATEEEEEAAFNEIASEYEDAVQRHLDATARTRGYDNILSACSYAAGTHPKFSVEGRDCIAWRSAVWEHSFQIMADVRAKLRPIPTIEQVIAELPEIAWSV